MSMRKSVGFAGIIIVAIVLGAIGYRFWTGSDPATAAAPADETPARVVAAVPVKKTLQRVTVQPGQIEAFEQTPLFAKLPGYVKEYHHDIGDTVDAGKPLAELSIPELNDEERQKDAMVKYAAADILRAHAEITGALGNRERWKSEYDRMVSLNASHSVDQKLEDETKAELAAAEAAVEKANADLAIANAALDNAKADLARTQSLLKYTQIDMPYKGVVVQRNVNRGDFVQPATMSGAKPLFVVVRNDKVRVFADVPEMEAALVRDGAKAKVRVQALPKKKIEDVVTRSSWALGPNHNLRAEIDLPNADGVLRPGMYARVEIVLEEHPGALSLPPAAVFTVENQAYCCCIADGRVVRKPITLGLRTSDDVEVTGGLKGDEIVVQSQPTALRDGQRAEVAKP